MAVGDQAAEACADRSLNPHRYSLRPPGSFGNRIFESTRLLFLQETRGLEA
jgi:hypothetical protein